MIVETIPIPRNRARAAEDFEVRVSDLHAWSGHELFLEFEYNDHMDRFIWQLEDVQYGKFWPKGTATLEYQYSAYPYFECRFIRLNEQPEHVTSQNLGREVKLAIIPGPRGGSYHPDADISEAEERRMLSRRAYDPVW